MNGDVKPKYDGRRDHEIQKPYVTAPMSIVVQRKQPDGSYMTETLETEGTIANPLYDPRNLKQVKDWHGVRNPQRFYDPRFKGFQG